jgi:hypothetical protein
MSCDLEALFSVEQKLRNVFANPSFVRHRAHRNVPSDQGARLLPFTSINSLGDPQQHLLQALAVSMSLLGLQVPIADNFARWCSSNNAEYDLQAASSVLKQLVSELCLQKRHINAVYADSRVISQLIKKYGVLDDPSFAVDVCETDAAGTRAIVTQTASGSNVRSPGSTWEIKVLKLNIDKSHGKYKKASLNLNLHDGFFSPRLQPHANSAADGWYIRARMSFDNDSFSLDHWFSPIFPKSMQISLIPNLSFIEELSQSLASGSDQDVINHLQECKLTIELWRHKPKRQDFVMFSCSSYLKHQSLGLAAATIHLQPDSFNSYGISGKAAGMSPEFEISGIFELFVTRRRALEPRKSIFDLVQCEETAKSSHSFLSSDSAPLPDSLSDDEKQLRTKLDSEGAVLRNWTFMCAAAALLIQHDSPQIVVNTVMFLYCFTSGLAFVHARDCQMIARSLLMKCSKRPLINALEMLMLLDDFDEPRNYSALDVYSLVDTTRIALRTGAVDLMVMSARHYLENIMLYPHDLQLECLPVLLKIASQKSSFDDRSNDAADNMMFQLQCATQSWNTCSVQSIRSMQIVMEASGHQLQRLLTLSIMFCKLSDELEFQLVKIAPIYPAEMRPKQVIARNLCSLVVVYTQAFIIEGSEDDKFDSNLLVQVLLLLFKFCDTSYFEVFSSSNDP